jgi:hypothetical protein
MQRSTYPSRFHRSAVGLVLSGVMLVVPTQAHAQQRVELGARRGCETCTIELERMVTLGDRQGEGYVGFPAGVGQLSTGEWVMVQVEHLSQIAVFGPGGEFRRRVGRLGSGPGEFRQIMYLGVGPGDSVRVYDALTGRLSVLDRQLVMRRSLQLGIAPPSHFVFEEDGSFIASVTMRGVDHLGFPLHLFTSEGKVVRSFGTLNPAYRARRDPRRNWRSTASAGNGRIWSARLTEYVVELWTTDGDLIAEYRREVDWFEPHEKVGFNGDDPPNPGLASIFLDQQGRLWTLVRVADENWRRGVGPTTNPYGHNISGVTDRSAYWDTVLEVFDSGTGTVLASRRFPEYLTRFNTQGFAIGYREDEAGFPFVDVFRIHLRPGGL